MISLPSAWSKVDSHVKPCSIAPDSNARARLGMLAITSGEKS